MKFHFLSDSRTQSTFFCLRRIIEYYRFFDVVSTRSLWLCSKDKGIVSYLYALAGVWPTCGVVRLDYCLYLLLGRIPWLWTIGYRVTRLVFLALPKLIYRSSLWGVSEVFTV